MTDQEINIAIAEACGWTSVQWHVPDDGPAILIGIKEGMLSFDRVPHFCADLNAILPLLPTGTTILCFENCYTIFNATETVTCTGQDLAMTACEFYLRTLNLWKD